MKLEKQVCNKNLAIRIETLGVKQDSLFYWYKNKYIKKFEIIGNGRVCVDNASFCFSIEKDAGDEVHSAFTTTELGKMLKDDEYTYFLWGYYLQKRDCFDLILESHDRTQMIFETRAKTEADVRAKMLIYLIENKLIKAKK